MQGGGALGDEDEEDHHGDKNKKEDYSMFTRDFSSNLYFIKKN